MSAREEPRAPALPFATTNYTEDQEGVLRAVLPSRCVYAAGEQTCVMFVDHYRERKTGPCFPVAVVGCRVHAGRRYTLYPPGHYPYGRVSYAPYSTTGQVLVDAESGQPQWEATLFEAALDAEREERWPSEQQWWERLEVPRRRTQERRLEVAGRLTGVHPQLAEDARERIATRLGVATMVLIAGARAWGRWWRTRGSAVTAVLHALAGGASLLDRLAAAGAVSDLWGPPRPRRVARWEAAGASWVLAPARGSAAVEQHTGGVAHRRPPPHTTVAHRAACGGATVGA